MPSLTRCLALAAFLACTAAAQAGLEIYHKLKVSGTLSYSVPNATTTEKIKTETLDNAKLFAIFGLAAADYQLVMDMVTNEVLFLAKAPGNPTQKVPVCTLALDFSLLTGTPGMTPTVTLKGYVDVESTAAAVGTFFEGADGRGTLSFKARNLATAAVIFDAYSFNVVFRALHPAPGTGNANAIVTLKGVAGARLAP